MTADEERDLCRRFEARIRGYGLRHLRDRSAAEDLVQHVLLSVLVAVRAGKVEDLGKLDAYVLGTCRYAVMDMRRGDARRQRLAAHEAAELPRGYEPRWEAVDRFRLETCLGGLDARDRAVVVATFLEDRDADEIARTLTISPGNVRVIRHRALARLQTCIEGSAP